MNVVMSLIPPKLMKLANLFGFHGDRRVGLEALEFASNSQDFKAPLARSAECSSKACIRVPSWSGHIVDTLWISVYSNLMCF